MNPFRQLPLLLAAACLLGPSALPAADLPNILWITSEDNGPHLGCYGDSYAITPNLDQLAAKGMRYTNASSNAPVCAPARTTIIAGVYPTSMGAQHMRSTAPLPPGFKMNPQFLRAAGYYCTNNSKEDYNLEKPEGVWDESSKNGHWKDRNEGQPFFAIFNHTISHESQIRNTLPPEAKIHDRSKAPIPAYHPDTPEVRDNWAQYYDRMTMMDDLAGKNLAELEASGLADNTIIFYYGDHGSGMPRSKRWPYRSGLNVPLIVYFPEKWKHLAPKDYTPGGASDRPVAFVDLAPTLLSLIGQEPPEWMQGHAFAGPHQTEAPEYSYGFRGRMDERYDCVRTVMGKRYIYLRHYMPHRIYGQHVGYMFVTPTTQVWHRLHQEGKLNEAQALFWQRKPAEELYDFLADPDEVVNLVNSDQPEHQAALKAMRQAHDDWVMETRDLGYLSEGEIHRRAREAGVTPYEMGHDDALYDLKTIHAAAKLATSLDPADLPTLVSFLQSEDSGVRFWGARGLLIHEEAGVEAGRDALSKALKDPNGPVSIVAAEALGRYGTDAEKAAALELLLSRSNQVEGDVFDAILAMNAIDYLDDTARPALDRLQALPDKPGQDAPKRVSGYVGRLLETVTETLAQ